MFGNDRKLHLVRLLDHYGVTPEELNNLDREKRNVLLQADLAHLKKVFTLINDPVELFSLSNEQFSLLVNRVDEIDVLISHGFSIDEFKAANPTVIAKWLNLPDELSTFKNRNAC